MDNQNILLVHHESLDPDAKLQDAEYACGELTVTMKGGSKEYLRRAYRQFVVVEGAFVFPKDAGLELPTPMIASLQISSALGTLTIFDCGAPKEADLLYIGHLCPFCGGSGDENVDLSGEEEEPCGECSREGWVGYEPRGYGDPWPRFVGTWSQLTAWAREEADTARNSG